MLCPDWNAIASPSPLKEVSIFTGYQHYQTPTNLTNQLVGERTYKQLVVKYYSSRVLLTNTNSAVQLAIVINKQTHRQFNN